jgi:cysteine-rich repeat protein
MLLKTIFIIPLATIFAASGCTDSHDPAVCPSGLICPAGTICAANQDTCISGPCGNGIIDVRAGEMCDDGNIISGDGCRQDCQSAETCGNGIVDFDEGEACDAGKQTATCNADCTLAICGDGKWNPAADEQCDTSGNSESCNHDCTPSLCGDGIANSFAGEQCDDGNRVSTDECTELCELAACTDGLQNADESDVDCGGHCGPDSCKMLQSCSHSEDCMGGVCLGGTCVPDWGRLVTGSFHNCALLGSGSVRCWGDGDYGQLGYGYDTGNIGDDEPAAWGGNVTVGGSVRQLVAGGSHTCALLDSGSVRCWGGGGNGQLGYGNTNSIGDDEYPASAGDVNVGETARQLVAGVSHTCALLGSGSVRCWGSGLFGQLGYGDVTNIGDDEHPAAWGNVDVGGTVIQLAAGSFHTCALLDSGSIRCWGNGFDGQLGYGRTNHIGDDETPASAGDIDVGGTVIQIAAGSFHTCGLLDSGSVRCWGNGSNGQLGYGNTTDIGDNEPPASAGDIDLGGSAVALAGGAFHTCALLDTGAVRCWGANFAGQLGYGNTTDIGDDESPALAGNVNVGGAVRQISVGARHTCVLLDSGAVRCWGDGDNGQLGYGNTNIIGDNEFPASAGDVNIGGSLLRAVVSSFHTCYLRDSGTVRCWHDAGDGQLGYGNIINLGGNVLPESAGNVNVADLLNSLTAVDSSPRDWLGAPDTGLAQLQAALDVAQRAALALGVRVEILGQEVRAGRDRGRVPVRIASMSQELLRTAVAQSANTSSSVAAVRTRSAQRSAWAPTAP